jgi:hypothetical protein
VVELDRIKLKKMKEGAYKRIVEQKSKKAEKGKMEVFLNKAK